MRQRLARLVSRSVALAALLLLLAWLVGRLLTDRYLITQFIFWAPAFLLLPAAVVLALLARWPRLRRHRLDPPERYRRSRLAAFALLFGLAACLFTVLVDWRVPWGRLAAGPNEPTETRLTLAHWNATTPDIDAWTGSLLSAAGPRPPDIFLISSFAGPARLAELAAPLRARFAPGHVERHGQLAVVSRYPVLRSGLVSLGLPTVEAGPAPTWYARVYNRLGRVLGLPHRQFDLADTGSLLFAELETTTLLGRPLVVWFIDLPSSPTLHRRAIAAQARGRLDELWQSGWLPGSRAPGVFGPDVLAGDFNIPRSSGSLGVLAPGMESAFGQSGVGRQATWPRTLPVLAIDHVFLAPPLRAVSYETFDPGVADHRVQVVVVAAPRPAAPQGESR